MPYATIQEVWGGGFEKSPEYYGYDENILLEDEENDKTGQHKRLKNPKEAVNRPIPISSNKSTKRSTNMSRTYDRLPMHNGPINRLGRVGKKSKTARDGNVDQGYILEEDVENPSESELYMRNRDAPITEYTRELEEGYTELTEEGGKSKEDLIKSLIAENKRLRELLEEAKVMEGGTKDNLFDLGLFISAGVFIIITMEAFSKGIRRF